MPKVKGVAERDSMSSEEEADANCFIVERILNKRVVNGRAEYAVKWKGYPDTENTWEPRAHFKNSKKLVTDFERKLKVEERQKNSNPKPSVGPKGQGQLDVNNEENFDKEVESEAETTTKNLKVEKRNKKKTSDPKTKSEVENTAKKEQEALTIKTEFEKGYTPERIIGATEKSGEVIFIIKWANMNKADLVRAADAKVMWPQTVIEFYEHHFTMNGCFRQTQTINLK